MRARVGAAIERAQQGEATVIEALSYRMSDHTTADDASRYRTQEELDQHAACDPISRLNSWLCEVGHWSDAQEQALQQELTEQVDEAVKQYLSKAAQQPTSMFDYLYETLPAAYQAQRDELAGAPNAAQGDSDNG